ncbi:MAG TPA: Scr1 family TA system antitoxin-like transcriptional regulator [Acidimicrobiales bacterium]|nr:Scr1 family TA system antitoxin-like transcriptional regulator [Acidimicrobiales bacterium]
MVAGIDDPAVRGRRLRADLRRLRDRAGFTQRDVASAMDWSLSKVIRIENGSVGISANDLRVLLPYYGIDDTAEINGFIEASKVARKDPWSEFRDVHSAAFLSYLGFESSAKRVLQYEPALVPGLLQTEEYADATMAGVYLFEQKSANRRWAARQRRQELHESADPPKMHFILDEAVIRRHVGGASVMRRQLERLKFWGEQKHILLQIVPFSAGAHPGMKGPVVILEFEDDDDLLYLEDAAGSTTRRDDPEETAPRRELFSNLEEIALSEAQTRDVIDGAIRDLLKAPDSRTTKKATTANKT